MQIKLRRGGELGRAASLAKFLPCLVIMIMIFYFSAADSESSSQTSGSIAESLVGLVHLRLPPEVVEAINGIIRKAAHFTEYMVLAAACLYACSGWAVRPLYLYGGVQIFCTLYAVSDEIHQYFVPGRWCQLGDVMIDSAGAAAGLLICMLFLEIRKKKRGNHTKKY